MLRPEIYMARVTACCRKGLINAGYAWVRKSASTQRFLLRYCTSCRTSHCNELFHVNDELEYCLRCLAQNVSLVPDGPVMHLYCHSCGQASAYELEDPINPDVWNEQGDDLFG